MSPIFDHFVPGGEWGLVPAAAVFLALVIGHALADYPLQGEFLAMGKNRHHAASIPNAGRGKPSHVWVHCMTSHALIHAGTVLVVLGLFWYAVAEFVLHWIIDYLKCENVTSFTQDQLLHILCKAVFVALVWQGVGVPAAA